MKNKITAIIFLLSVLSSANLLAQGSVAKADKTYETNGYAEAIDLYLASQSSDPDAKMDRKSMIRLANSYRLIGDYQNAEKWYSQIVESSNKPLYRLYYAQALQSNGKCELSKKYFLEYHELITNDSTNLDFDKNGKLDGRGKTLAEGCDTDFVDRPTVEVKNESALNSEHLDMTPMYYKDGVVFASNRGIPRPKTNTDTWLDEPFIDLFVSYGDESGYSEPVPFSKKINSRFHEGPTSFDRSGNIIYFTRSNMDGAKRGKNSRGQTKLKVYTAQWDEGEWQNIQELSFNSDQRNVCHPTLSADGTKIYFSTDRPGGFGGMDVYVSHFKEGRWSKPKNLGPEVNTRGNELFPFIHDDGTLYFSSNGHSGMGGLDIFTVQHVELGDTAYWAGVRNMGMPFNSAQDDFGFILDLRKKTGFFSSNRVGGKGADDIYSFRLPAGEELDVAPAKMQWDARLLVSDSKDALIEDAKITITNCEQGDGLMAKLVPIKGKEGEFTINIVNADGEGKAETMMTNKQGEVMYRLEAGVEYCFRAEKAGYEVAEQRFSAKSYTTDRTAVVNLRMKKKPTCSIVTGTVTNKQYKKAVPKTTITLVNKYTGDKETLTTDEKGKFEACLPCEVEYEIKGEKDEVGLAALTFSTVGKKCGAAANVELALVPEEKPHHHHPHDGHGHSAEKVHPEAMFNASKVGQQIILENIFYDYDKAYIRPEAAIDLDRLADIMKRHPSLMIELASHTDSRGSRGYNNNLSQSRADAAVRYLVKKGISTNRLIGKGYGKSQPIVECRNGEKCSEADHQQNRRTDFRILRLDENVDINSLYKNGF